MNFDQARFNMVEQQVRPWDVLETRILELFKTIHREDFVPVRYRKMAFADLAIPMDNGQSMMKPVVEGRLLQSLELKADEFFVLGDNVPISVDSRHWAAGCVERKSLVGSLLRDAGGHCPAESREGAAVTP